MISERRSLATITLRTKIIMVFLVITILSLGVLAFVYNQAMHVALTDKANQTLYAAASRTAVSLDAFIELNLDHIRTEAMLPDIRAFMSLPPDARQGNYLAERTAETLETLRNQDLTVISSYALLDHKGINIMDTVMPDVGKDESNLDCFTQPYALGLPYMSPIHFPENVGEVYFCFSSPVRNELGQIVGVLRARYSVAILQHLVSESRGLAGQGSFAMLFDEYDFRIAHDNTSDLLFRTVRTLDEDEVARLARNGRLPNLSPAQLTTRLPALQQGLANADTQPFFAADANTGDTENEQMVAIRLENMPWTIVYAQSEESFLAPVRDALTTTILLVVILSSLVIITAVLAARWLARPITRLTTVAGQITEGNLMARATVESHDEIGRLAEAFNSMTAQLQQTLEGLEQRNKELQDQIHERERAEAALQHAKEAAEQANYAKSQFLANMSHELRTPLNGILGYTQLLLQNSQLDSNQKASMEIIQRSGNHLLALINDLLDLSQIEAGGMELRYAEFNLPSLLDNINAIIQLNMVEKGVAFTYQLFNFATGEPDNHLPTYVYGDKIRLQQILFNLLDNALKFTPMGKVIFRVGVVDRQRDEISPAEAQRQKIRFQVGDTGIGIAAEQLEYIFQPFTQADTEHRVKGTGLGLSISSRLVKMMGSELKVESQLNRGSIFWFDLDLAIIHTKTAVQSPTYRQTIGYQGPPQKVLIVDDWTENRHLLVDILQPLGFICLEAVNGLDGLEKAQEHKPDVILADLLMPECDGLTMARQIRQDPDLAHIVLIAVSADALQGERQRCLDAGFDSLVTKPIWADSLLKQLQNLLGLTWRYDTDDVLASNGRLPDSPPPSTSAIINPPPDIVKTLHDLALMGDVAALNQAIQQLEQTNQYAVFFEHVNFLVRGFQIERLGEFLESCLEEQEK